MRICLLGHNVKVGFDLEKKWWELESTIMHEFRETCDEKHCAISNKPMHFQEDEKATVQQHLYYLKIQHAKE